jgi:hypothetical protein
MAEQARPRWLKGCFPAVLGRGGGIMTTPNFTADPDPATRGEIHRGLFRLLFPLPHLMSCVAIFNTARDSVQGRGPHAHCECM